MKSLNVDTNNNIDSHHGDNRCIKRVIFLVTQFAVLIIDLFSGPNIDDLIWLLTGIIGLVFIFVSSIKNRSLPAAPFHSSHRGFWLHGRSTPERLLRRGTRPCIAGAPGGCGGGSSRRSEPLAGSDGPGAIPPAMKAMVFAAGRGRRLQPLTDTRPKALVEVAGRTLLEHVLRRLVEAGVTEVIINLQHLGRHIPALS